jgi:hypothetical protein
VRTVLKIGEDVNFVDSSFFQFGKFLEFLGLYTFDGYLLFGFEIDGLEDSGVDASAELLL